MLLSTDANIIFFADYINKIDLKYLLIDTIDLNFTT